MRREEQRSDGKQERRTEQHKLQAGKQRVRLKVNSEKPSDSNNTLDNDQELL